MQVVLPTKLLRCECEGGTEEASLTFRFPSLCSR